MPPKQILLQQRVPSSLIRLAAYSQLKAHGSFIFIINKIKILSC